MMKKEMEDVVKYSDQVDGRGESQYVCKPCDKRKQNTVAQLYCITCQEYQCVECSKVHEIYDFLKGHELIDAKLANPSKPGVDMNGLDMCKDHSKSFEFFCVDHQSLCCTYCVCTCHRRCNEVNELSSEAKKSNPGDLRRLLFECDQDIETVDIYRKDIIDLLDIDLETILTKIEEMRGEAMIRFDDIKESVTKRISKKNKETADIIDEKILKASEIVNDYKQVYTDMFKSDSVEQRFIIQCLVKDMRPIYQKTITEELSGLHRASFTLKQ